MTHHQGHWTTAGRGACGSRRKSLLLGMSAAAALVAGGLAPAAPTNANGTRAAHTAPIAGEPATIANRIWAKLLTRCGDTYFYEGSVFDGSGIISDVQVSHQKTIEYKGVRFHIVPIRVTDAERANGIAYRDRISMVAHLYREEGEPWRDGPGLQPRNFDDIAGQALSKATSDLFDMGGAGAIALQIVKFKGTWAVERSSVDSSSEIGFGSHFFDVEKVLAADVPRHSCNSGSKDQ